jgi:hypothetical protein
MRRCSCTACLLKAALELLRSGRAGMATRLVEQALEQVEREAKRATPPARARKARARHDRGRWPTTVPRRVPRHLLASRAWRSAEGRRHRLLDEAGWATLDRDRDRGRLPSTAELEQLRMTHDHKPSIVLAELWERESQHGNRYFSGFWGGLSVALLRDGERPHPTRPGEVVTVWKLVAQERDRPPRPPAKPPERDPGSGRATAGALGRWRVSWRLWTAFPTRERDGTPGARGRRDRDRLRPRRRRPG